MVLGFGLTQDMISYYVVTPICYLLKTILPNTPNLISPAGMEVSDFPPNVTRYVL